MPRPRRRGRRLRDPARSRASPTDGALCAAPGRVPGQGRRAVRVLHPGPADVRPRAARGASAPDPRRDRGGDGGQPLPLRLLRADLRRDPHAPPRGPTDDRRRASATPPTASAASTASRAPSSTSRTSPVADALHAKLVTLDCARARILGIDASAALALPGVHLVMTADDLPKPMPRFGPQNQDRPVLAVGETKYHGDPVALVVAETRELAEAAAGLVRVEHEELPAVFTVAGALAPDAPLVQDPVAAPRRPAGGHQRAHRAPRRLGRRRRRGGPARTSSSRAATRSRWSPTSPSSRTRSWPPPTATGIAVWSTIQHPNWLQKLIAGLVRHAARRRCGSSRRIPGGGFGGKQHTKHEPAVVFAALKVGRPVRLVLTLEESFQAARRAACESRVRTGFDRDGRIAVPGHRGRLPHRRLRGHRRPRRGQGLATRPPGRTTCRPSGSSPGSILSHTVPSTAFRGFGNPQINWAVESHAGRGRQGAGHRPARDPAAQPGPQGRPVHPVRHALRRRLGADGPARRRADRVGHAPARRAAAAASRWGSSPARPPASATPSSGSWSTAPSSSSPAPPTWARARGPCSRRSPRRSWARRWTGSRSSWATPRSCPTTSRPRHRAPPS